jgi:hypothetical protein
MKIRKTSSDKKKEANKRNAQSSTGPKTDRGKSVASRNSLNHGLFSEALHVAEVDMPMIDAIRAGLAKQLRPSTFLQGIAVDKVVTCICLGKSAVRFESTRLEKLNHAPVGTQDHVSESGSSPEMLRWCGSGRRDLNAGIRILQQLRADICQSGYVRDHWKDQITACIGSDFYTALREWSPLNPCALQLTRQMIAQSEDFNMPLPEPKEGDPVYVRDPQQEQEMILKLVDREIAFLNARRKTADQSGLAAEENDTAARVDFTPRYFSATMKELRLAVAWLTLLKEMGL